MTEVPLYNRVLLKLSGEALMGNQDFGLDSPHYGKNGRGYQNRY